MNHPKSIYSYKYIFVIIGTDLVFVNFPIKPFNEFNLLLNH